MVEDDQIQRLLNNAANDIRSLTNIAIKSGEVSREEVEELVERRTEIREMISNLEERGVVHSLNVGDQKIDDMEPTHSTEVNTVEVVELIDSLACNFRIKETGRTVAEHNSQYPSSDPVVVGVYPNMDSDERFFFPESRLI